MNSGIYKIRNILNGDFYLGSTQNFDKRKFQHFNLLKRNKHHSIHLQRAVNKYGISNFVFEIIEKCPQTDLLVIEQKLLTKLNPKYNIGLYAISGMKGRKHSLESRKKLSESHKGWKASAETREKQRIRMTGKKFDAEFCRKASENAIKNKHHLNFIGLYEKRKRKVVDSNGMIFNSLTECAKYHNIHVSNVCNMLKGKRWLKRIVFRYENEPFPVNPFLKGKVK